MKTIKIKILLKFLALAVILTLVVLSQTMRADPPVETNEYWKCLLAEATSEGYEGMYAVACVYRNRAHKRMPLGCAGLKRKDLAHFVRKEGRARQLLALKAYQDCFVKGGPDVTGGATHYENIKKFGEPNWYKSMIITKIIGNHVFMKEKTK